MRKKQKPKKAERVKAILYTIAIIIIIPVLFVNIFILIDSYRNPDKVPGFLSYRPFIVLSGSMEDVILTGDLVIVQTAEPSNLKKGDIIAFHSGDIVVVHRIHDITITEDGETKFVTKGDNNKSIDEELVSADKIEGTFLLRIPKLGTIALFLQTPTGLLISVSIPVLIIVVSQISTSRKYKKELEALKKQNTNSF